MAINNVLKKILLSKWLRVVISIILIYFAFRRVDIKNLFVELSGVPLKWVIFNILFSVVVMLLAAYRWSLFLFGKTDLKKVIDFSKASMTGSFYGLFFPSGVAGDFLKWVPLQKKYPEITKFKLFSSVWLDRFVGLAAFVFVAFISSSIAWILKFDFPRYLFWLFGLMSIGVIVFFIVVRKFDSKKLLSKFSKFKAVQKLNEPIELLKTNDKKVMAKCLLISLISELAWITQVWLVSNLFHAGFSMISCFVFLPIIALILILPISIAGFGAREQLYLFFFSQAVVTSDTKILLVSSFIGIIGVLFSLLSGLAIIF
jgi:uncharacterized membrane protein YbhN (UPF0104 family)